METPQEQTEAEHKYEFGKLLFIAKRYPMAKLMLRQAHKLEPDNIEYKRAYNECKDLIESNKKAGIINPLDYKEISLEELFDGNKEVN